MNYRNFIVNSKKQNNNFKKQILILYFKNILIMNFLIIQEFLRARKNDKYLTDAKFEFNIYIIQNIKI